MVGLGEKHHLFIQQHTSNLMKNPGPHTVRGFSCPSFISYFQFTNKRFKAQEFDNLFT
jgi:hypothetical protein